MAYKASTKRSTKKTEEKSSSSAKKTEEEIVSTVPMESVVESPVQSRSSEASVEDFIGGPNNETVVVPPEASVPEVPAQEITGGENQSHLSFEPVPQQQNRYQPRPRPQMMRQGAPRGGYRNYNARGGYSGGYDRGGYRRDNRGGSPMNQMGGYRRFQRDFTYTPTPTQDGKEEFTTDITVPTETVIGILDMMPEGHGFLRPKFTPSDRDVYISQSQIRRFLLRSGDQVQGQARQPKENERYWGLLKVEKINGVEAEGLTNRPNFEDLIPIYPNTLLRLETDQTPLSTRMIDLLSPIGFGQRGIIVSPPKAGKTTILKEIAAGVTANYPDVHLMAALIGERPEEVTDLTRSIKGEVLASNFDQSPPEQVRVAEIALERAKRLVEMGKDVVVLLDSITRLARAYNLVVNPSGRTLSGGFDPAALYPAKKFLGAARCVEAAAGSEKTTGGSLTVIGTALVDTGSRMDDLIYEEFKGTGNMELHLSRKLQERRIFPAIDIPTSGTRHDELMLGEDVMKNVTTLRHMLALLSEDEQSAMMIDRLSKSKSNAEFLKTLSQG